METSVIVGLLLIAAVWSVYLLPSVFGGRNAPGSSTEEFDRWTHLMADVQKRTYSRGLVTQRDVIRQRRRRTLAVLVLLAVVTAAWAFWANSLPLLLLQLFLDSLIGLYLAVLAQMRRQRQVRLMVSHVSERPNEWDEPQVRVIAH